MTELIPKNWARTTLEEITFPVGKWNKRDVNIDDEFIYIDINSVDNNSNKITNPKKYKYSEAPSRAQQVLKFGDILFSTVRTYLKNIAFLDLKYNNQIASTGFCVIRPVEPINKKYIFYLTLSSAFLEKLNEIQRGSSYPSVRNSDILGQSILLPPLKEQNRIVEKLDELLSEIENGKDQLKLVLNQIKTYKETVLKNAFLGNLSEKWREINPKRPSGAGLIKVINSHKEKQYEKLNLKIKKAGKESLPKSPQLIEINTKNESVSHPILPKGWIWVRLGEICSEVERVNSNNRNFSKEFIYLDIGGIDNERNIIGNYKVYDWGNAPSRAQQIIKVGDILFSTVRTYMKNIALVENLKYNHQIASTGFAVIRPESGYINSKYVFRYLLSGSFINPLNKLQTGSSYPAVRDKDVFNQYIPICSPEEQLYIVEELEKVLSLCNKLENTVSDTLKQSELLKQRILQKAVEGKLVDQNKDDEPAKYLIDRIKIQKKKILVEEKKERKEDPFTINIVNMVEHSKSLLELIRKSKKPISPLTLWQASEHKDDIDGFYSKLKEHIENGEIVELPRKGKEILLTTGTKK